MLLCGRVNVRAFYLRELARRQRAFAVERRRQLVRERGKRALGQVGGVSVNLTQSAHEPEPRAVNNARAHVIHALVVDFYRVRFFALDVQLREIRARAQRRVEHRPCRLFLHNRLLNLHAAVDRKTERAQNTARRSVATIILSIVYSIDTIIPYLPPNGKLITIKIALEFKPTACTPCFCIIGDYALHPNNSYAIVLSFRAEHARNISGCNNHA